MTHAEQHRMIVELMDRSHLMKGRDRDAFEMYVKRDKDDEDLDELTRKRLIVLHEKYVHSRRARA